MPFFSPQHLALAEQVIRAATAKKLQIATAESCTGGLIAACLTEVNGASAVFDRGYISYSYDSKTAYLDIPQQVVVACGAVSAEVARGMAEGALRHSKADIAIAATGIAGPGGGTPDKPVGLVYLGIALKAKKDSYATKNNFTGDRGQVRLQTVETALNMLKKEIEGL
jgi:nicotinamide-nucleotide amidase